MEVKTVALSRSRLIRIPVRWGYRFEISSCGSNDIVRLFHDECGTSELVSMEIRPTGRITMWSSSELGLVDLKNGLMELARANRVPL